MRIYPDLKFRMNYPLKNFNLGLTFTEMSYPMLSMLYNGATSDRDGDNDHFPIDCMEKFPVTMLKFSTVYLEITR
jgi:hypothetical protein